MASDLAEIRLLLLDVDGVLTDGTIELGEDGIERRRYHARDGIGIRMAAECGIAVGIVTSSPSEGIRTRAGRLGIDHVLIGVRDKEEALRSLAAQLGIPLEAVAFMGDDLVDLPAMRIAGLAVAVADAEAAVLECADLVTERPGGGAAARELCERLIEARDPGYLGDRKGCGLRL